jgi:hypothetical protein
MKFFRSLSLGLSILMCFSVPSFSRADGAVEPTSTLTPPSAGAQKCSIEGFEQLKSKMENRFRMLSTRLEIESEKRKEIFSKCKECEERYGEAWAELKESSPDYPRLAAVAYVGLHFAQLSGITFVKKTAGGYIVDGLYALVKKANILPQVTKALDEFARKAPKMAKGARGLGLFSVFAVAAIGALEWIEGDIAATKQLRYYSFEGFIERSHIDDKRLGELAGIHSAALSEVAQFMVDRRRLLSTNLKEHLAAVSGELDKGFAQQDAAFEELATLHRSRLQMDFPSGDGGVMSMARAESELRYSQERTVAMVTELAQIVGMKKGMEEECGFYEKRGYTEKLRPTEFEDLIRSVSSGASSVPEELAQISSGGTIPGSCEQDVKIRCSSQGSFSCLDSNKSVLSESCSHALGYVKASEGQSSKEPTGTTN